MKEIELLFMLARDNQIEAFIIGIFATFLESFLPILPLTAIVVMSAALQGFVNGVLSSTIGSALGTMILYILANKFRDIKYLKKHRNNRIDKITDWVRRQHYLVIYLCYSSPFIPSCLVSIASGYSNLNYKKFIPGMILGKLTMFLIASYIGGDINGLIDNPFRLIIIGLMIAISYFIGKVITKRMDSHIAD